MFCGQIHAPATVPNYIHTTSWISKFIASLYSLKPRMFVFMLSKGRFSFPSDEMCHAFIRRVLVCTFQYEASFTLPSVAVAGSRFVTPCFVKKFLAVYPAYTTVMNLNFEKNFLEKLCTKPGRLASLSLMTQWGNRSLTQSVAVSKTVACSIYPYKVAAGWLTH